MRPESTSGRVTSLAAAAVILVAVRLALAVLPFARVSRVTDRLARLPIRLPRHPPDRVGGRVARLARHLPGAACLAQSMAVRVLLAWHGHTAIVRVGVRRAADGVEAHAWVEHEGRVVFGGPEVSTYVPLEASQAPHAR